MLLWSLLLSLQFECQLCQKIEEEHDGWQNSTDLECDYGTIMLEDRACNKGATTPTWKDINASNTETKIAAKLNHFLNLASPVLNMLSYVSLSIKINRLFLTTLITPYMELLNILIRSLSLCRVSILRQFQCEYPRFRRDFPSRFEKKVSSVSCYLLLKFKTLSFHDWMVSPMP